MKSSRSFNQGANRNGDLLELQCSFKSDSDHYLEKTQTDFYKIDLEKAVFTSPKRGIHILKEMRLQLRFLKNKNRNYFREKYNASARVRTRDLVFARQTHYQRRHCLWNIQIGVIQME